MAKIFDCEKSTKRLVAYSFFYILMGFFDIVYIIYENISMNLDFLYTKVVESFVAKSQNKNGHINSKKIRKKPFYKWHDVMAKGYKC